MVLQKREKIQTYTHGGSHYVPTPDKLKPSWVVIDVKDKVLGRVATEIASALIGKNKVGYAPHMLSGDFVVVLNADKVRLTSEKAEVKNYTRHTGYPGGKKTTSFKKLMETFPERIIEHAVRGMLPKNKLGRHMYRRLKVYAGSEHPHKAQLEQ